MSKNIGKAERIIRVIIGFMLIAYATRIGFPNTGWTWVGWIGMVPILTGLLGNCPGYTLLGISTCGPAGERK